LFIATAVIFKLRQPAITQPDSVVMSSPVFPSQQNNASENVPSVIPNEQPTSVAQSEPLPVQPVANVVPRKSDGVVIANSNMNRGGGSYDEALPQKKPPLPAGIGASNPTSNANRSDVISTTPIPVQDMLSIVLGVSVDYADGWKVSAVNKNSVAQRAGIEPGDVIVSLDDKDLTAISQFQGSGSISKIGFKRNGVIKTVKLK
jgi:membrane-associated protease RseP (regulator of RpoE activity)